MEIIQNIQNRIYTIRNERIMLDFDLAELYEVETRTLNQSVKRNIERFPEDFMFQLSVQELESLRQKLNDVSSSQIVMMKQIPQNRTSKYLPYAFTEQGVAMLSGILRSPKAIAMNIAIMRAFVEIRRILIQQTDLKEQMQLIKDRLGEHDVQLNQIYDAMENLLDEKVMQSKWEDRQRIGFQK